MRRTDHGRTSVDELAWLRSDDRDDPEVLAHLRAENAYVDEVLGHTAELQDRIFEEIRSRIQETDLSPPSRHGPWWYYARTVEGLQYPQWYRVAAGDASEPPDPDDPAVQAGEQLLLDGNVEAGDHDYWALGVLDVSPDHSILAWADEHDGSERFRLRFRDLATGIDRPTVIDDVAYSSAWSAAGDTFLYTRTDDAWRSHQVWRHELATADPGADVLVFHETDERFNVGVGLSGDERWVLLVSSSSLTSEVHGCPADDTVDGWRLLVPRRSGIEVTPEHHDGRFVFLTNDDALDFRIVTAPVDTPDPAHWTDLVAHRPGVRLESFDVVAGRVVVHERTEATTRLRVVEPDGGEQWTVEGNEAISTITPAHAHEASWPWLRFVETSLVTPPTVTEIDLRSRRRVVRKVTPVLGGYDPSDYVSERLWATSSDGTRVPISMVAHRDRIAPGPVLLYGYGSYELSMDPTFSPVRLSLLDRGWAYAIAHVRGGGEMGRQWYLDARLATKERSIDDLIAAAEALEAQGVAAPGTVAVGGGSAGGLLVGAAVNRAPDRFGAVLAEVPFVDTLNSMLDPTLPLTIGEYEEWGDPLTSVEIYDAIAAYSPYDNVGPGPYPPILATGGLHDPRVGYWEPAKWIARLRERASGGPFLVRTELGSGHGGPSGRYDAWRDHAFHLAFLLDAVGLGRPNHADARSDRPTS